MSQLKNIYPKFIYLELPGGLYEPLTDWSVMHMVQVT